MEIKREKEKKTQNNNNKEKALFSCAENQSLGSSAMGDEKLGSSCGIGAAGSSPSHPTVPPCRDLLSICLWLKSTQGKEKPPSLGMGWEEPGRLFEYFKWESRGGYQTGLFVLPTFPIGKKINRVCHPPPANARKMPQRSSGGFFPYRALEG